MDIVQNQYSNFVFHTKKTSILVPKPEKIQ